MKEVRFAESLVGDERIPNTAEAMTLFVQNIFATNTSAILNDILPNARSTPAQRTMLLRCLPRHVSKFTTQMISSLLQVNMIALDEMGVLIYLRLLLDVVSAKSVYCERIIIALVDRLVKNEFSDVLLDTLKSITKLIPTSAQLLLQAIKSHAPYRTAELEKTVSYVRVLMVTSSFGIGVRRQMLDLVIGIVIELDLECLELDTEVEEDMFVMDDERTVGADEDDEELDDDEGDDMALQVTTSTGQTALKLDMILCLLFEYFKALQKDDHHEFLDLFDGLLVTFDRVILPTHKLRSVQFLVFYVCSLEPTTFSDEFMGLLMGRLIDSANPAIMRMVVSAYLGSFVARATYIEISSVRTCLALLNQQCLAMVERDELGNRKEDDGVFYSTVQAILYIFCFRWKQLMLVSDRPTTGKFPSELFGFERILLSRFAPLKVCSDVVVQEFAKVTMSLNIMYCYPLLVNPDTQASEVQEHSISKRLETFFPFDPLLLKTSKTYISGSFQEWDDEDDEDEEMTESERNMRLLTSDSERGYEGSNSTYGMSVSLDERFSLSISH